MNRSWLIPIVTFIAGAILMMVLMQHCDNQQTSQLEQKLKKYQDSVVKTTDANNVLNKQKLDLEFEKSAHDSLSSHTIDSLKSIIRIVKSKYYTDTAKFKKTIGNLQSAFDKKDSGAAQVALDSLVIEARSANWEATNIFYQYGEMDSLWRLQKAYDDSTYDELAKIDSAREKRLLAMFSINTQLGEDYDRALAEIKRLKTGKKFWFAIGAILGAATNFLHK